MNGALTEDPSARGVFLATAHPAKFREIVEPAIGQPVALPPELADALRRPRAAGRDPEVTSCHSERSAEGAQARNRNRPESEGSNCATVASQSPAVGFQSR